MTMKKDMRSFAYALSAITQLGLRIAASFLIWIGIAAYLKRRFCLTDKIMLLGIICGMGSAVLSLVHFCRVSVSHCDKKEENSGEK